MVVIRLARVGKKNSPAYRVVIAEKQRAVKRKFIEVIGHYNPTQTPKELVIDKERALFWMSQGAKASDTVNNLMADLGIIEKSSKINKVYGKKLTKKAIKEGPAAEAKPAPAETEAEEITESAAETDEASAVAETVEVADEPKAEEAVAENTEEASEEAK